MYVQERFDSIFSTVTGYGTLDDRIAKTKKKKGELLLVLDYPNVPLHNNLAEIAVREGVIKRKISYGTRSELGKLAWENMLSIIDTCRKLGISFTDIFMIYFLIVILCQGYQISFSRLVKSTDY
jgi:hypothetical protein